MANQRRDPPRKLADIRSEVLSESTDLDALLEAILGDDGAPVPATAARPEASIIARREASVVARPGPTLVSPPDLNVGQSAETDDEVDAAWGENLREFLAGVKKQDLQAIDQRGAATESVPFIEVPVASRSWRDMIPVPTTRQSLLVGGLFAAALITLGAISLRDRRDDSVVPPSPAAVSPAPVPPTSTVEPPSPAPASVPATIAVTAAGGATAKPRVVTPPSPGRATERTEPVRPEVQPRNPQPPIAAPVNVAPTTLQRVVDEPNNVAVPPRTAIPDSDPRPATSSDPRPATSAPAPAAPAPTAAGAQPVAPTSVSSVPPAVARRTAPRLLVGGSPEYPPALRTAKVGGIVEVRFVVDSSGRPINVQSVSGPAQLRSAAEAAVKRWRYEPAHLGNVAVETATSVNFNFDPSAARRPQD